MNFDAKSSTRAAEAAAKAQELNLPRNEAEGLVSKAASVLAHQGPTAFFLFLRVEGPPPAKKDKEGKWVAAKQVQKFAERLSQSAYFLLRDAFAELGDCNEKDLELNDAEGRKAILDESKRRLEGVTTLGEELSSLLMAKRLLDQMMIYLRYHVRVLPDRDKATAKAGRP